MGDLDLELWPKETPRACRNFIQLCMEGYYTNTIFHRIVKGFIMQGGDPTGTGFGGESIYGEPFSNEYHQRLRFNHRGLVAMVNIEPNQNLSQFFITLDKCEELDGKHTIFGKITGDTIFNVLKANDFELDEQEKPLFPPKITSIDIISNPFSDIVPRERKKSDKPQAAAKKTQKKNLSLLSFGEEAQEEDSGEAPKMKSSAFVSDNPQERESAIRAQEAKNAKRDGDLLVPKSRSRDPKKKTSEDQAIDDREMQLELDKYENSKKGADDRVNVLREEQKKLKREIAKVGKKEDSLSDKQFQSAVEKQRAKYLAKKRKTRRPDEDMLMQELDHFTSNLKSHLEEGPQTPSLTDAPSEETLLADFDEDLDNLDEEARDGSGWMSHIFQLKPDNRESKEASIFEEKYKVFDPLAKQEKRPTQHQRRLQGHKNVEKF
eukprot:TRINITY_DN2458_c0_g1_i1.p1 TRINITY_DN2458_c0_g1~~TRINITY_DN2458_c0_g1_i1.p1  ORF type:complete len:457 (+),score=142.25 TRINITY_DN2458_c0_g1_i1:70-1371(+)